MDRGKKLDTLLSLGADHVIDYTKEDITKSGKQYDLVLGVVSNRSIYDYRRTLKPEGTFVYVGGNSRAIFQSIIIGPMISRRGTQKMGIVLGQPNKKEDLNYLAELFEAGKVVPVIDRSYRLEETPEAMRYLEDGHAIGKVIITME